MRLRTRPLATSGLASDARRSGFTCASRAPASILRAIVVARSAPAHAARMQHLNISTMADLKKIRAQAFFPVRGHESLEYAICELTRKAEDLHQTLRHILDPSGLGQNG